MQPLAVSKPRVPNEPVAYRLHVCKLGDALLGSDLAIHAAAQQRGDVCMALTKGVGERMIAPAIRRKGARPMLQEQLQDMRVALTCCNLRSQETSNARAEDVRASRRASRMQAQAPLLMWQGTAVTHVQRGSPIVIFGVDGHATAEQNLEEVSTTLLRQLAQLARRLVVCVA